MRNRAEWYLPARRWEEYDISSATAVFHEHCYEIREITVHKFSRRGFRWCAQRNLLMQIRRSWEREWEWFWLTIRESDLSAFHRRAVIIRDCRYQITALNFHVLTSGPRDFHTPLPLWNLLTPIKRACPACRATRKNSFIAGRTYTFDLILLFALERLSTGGTSIESNFALALTVTELSS